MRALLLISLVILSSCSTREELDRHFAAKKQGWIDKGLTPEAAEERAFEEMGTFEGEDEPLGHDGRR